VNERVVRLLGLGLRAGRVVIGVAGVRAQLQRDAVHCVVLAGDASVRTLEKVARLARARGVPIVQGSGERRCRRSACKTARWPAGWFGLWRSK
jgi:ribosomal protein L7Ae-like RNA K-turn-binding protein